MKRILSTYFLPTLLVFAIGGVLGMRIDGTSKDRDEYEQVKKLEHAFLLITQQYVEEIDPEKLAESAIQEMLKALDPHSIYIDARNVPKVQDEYQGSFGGIGIWFEVPPNDTARVTSTTPDGPGEGVGLMAGDRLIAVDGENIIGFGSLDIQNKIKGRINSTVVLTVVRSGVDDPIVFSIRRKKIPLFSIDASYMIDNVTGYVRIGRFAMTTPDEFREHVGRLKTEGLKRLIVDLRGNPGGVKDAAVKVADEMLDGRGIIVSTRGRDARENSINRITRGGVLSSEPVIVLVDETSASGSEIVAGALQDHDRALIVGRRTFGKGLVQRPFPLRDGSVLQMTVARYYMPSGRLIQTPYTNGELKAYYDKKLSNFEKAILDPKNYLKDIPDSLKFETTHGRTVFGGGGVMPDVVVAPDSTSDLASPLVQSMLRTGVPFLFVRDLIDNESTLRDQWGDQRSRFISDYRISASLWEEFLAYAKIKKFTISEAGSNHEEGIYSAAELSSTRLTIETILKARIAQRLFRAEAWYPIFNQIDPMVQSALDLWTNAETLSAYHAPGGQRSSIRGDG